MSISLVEAKTKKPRVELSAKPRLVKLDSLSRPSQKVFFTARIVGLDEISPEEKEAYYCLTEKWDFGNGEITFSTPNCEPYKDNLEIKDFFEADAEYDLSDIPQNLNPYFRGGSEFSAESLNFPVKFSLLRKISEKGKEKGKMKEKVILSGTTTIVVVR